MAIPPVTFPQLESGVEVEVRTRFTARWSTGFEVDRVIGDQIRVRRRSDGFILPVPVSLDDIRPSASPRAPGRASDPGGPSVSRGR
jgi:hypothetical protein